MGDRILLFNQIMPIYTIWTRREDFIMTKYIKVKEVENINLGMDPHSGMSGVCFWKKAQLSDNGIRGLQKSPEQMQCRFKWCKRKHLLSDLKTAEAQWTLPMPVNYFIQELRGEQANLFNKKNSTNIVKNRKM